MGGWGVIFLLFATIFNSRHVWLYMISFLIFNTGVAFVFSNGSAKAVDLAGSKRGTASSVLSSMEQLFAAIASFVFGHKVLFYGLGIFFVVVVLKGVFQRIFN